MVVSNSLPKCKSHLKYLSGARTKDLEYYVVPTLKQKNQILLLLHIGFNDIDFPQLRHNTVKNIGKDTKKSEIVAKQQNPHSSAWILQTNSE